MLKPLILLFFLFSLITTAGAQITQDNTDNKEDASGAQQEMKERFLNLERRILDQNELGLRRLEHVEERINSSQQYVDRILLIFALSILLIFLFIFTGIKNQQKIVTERVHRSIRDADNLMRDIQRDLARPEMEHLRISQILRRLMRQLRNQNNNPQNAAAAGHVNEIRHACNDPYLPVSLHFIARILIAEYDDNWNTAAQMLEQLREMDPSDSDVLLHLSHVHKNIATRASNQKLQNLHQRLSYQYYGQFTAAVQSEQVLAPNESLAPPASMPAAPPPITNTKTSAPTKAPAPPPPVTNTVAPATPTTPPPATTTSVPIPKAPPPAPENKPTTVNTATAPTAPSTSATSTAPTFVPTTTPTTQLQPSAPNTKTAITVVNPKRSEKMILNELTKIKNIQPSAVLDTLADSSKHFLKKSLSGSVGLTSKLQNLFQTFSEKDSGPLPFLPVPATSIVPQSGEPNALKMWQEIKNGDLNMERATTAKTIRERNKFIDSAIISYTQAQSYDTNEILYHNWGIALLAKALHVPEKKRAPFYNSAVDKFLAGNVVKAHYFDFHIASLYAIIGNSKECLKWLTVTRENNGIDVGALRQAPDFDLVRHEPWFDQFLSD